MSAILVVNNQSEISRLLPWAWMFAKSAELQLTVIVAQQSGGKRIWKDIQVDTDDVSLLDAFQAIGTKPPNGIEASEVEPLDHSEVRYKQLRDAHPDRAILDLLPSLQAKMLIIQLDEPSRDLDKTWEGRAYRRANCESILLRVPAGATLESHRILIPTNGDTNANTALRRGYAISQTDQREVTALYVSSQMDRLSREAAEKTVDDLVTGALGRRGNQIERKVELAVDFPTGMKQVLNAADTGQSDVADRPIDLVMIGAYKNRTIRNVFQRKPGNGSSSYVNEPAFAAVKAGVAIGPRYRQAIERVIQQWVPQIDREGRKELFRHIENSSEWNFDFIALICLSTLIAALGLARNQAPVVIGAMLVAPLMTPLVGAGLALVQGNSELIWKALQSVIYGFMLAFLIGWTVGLVGIMLPVLEMDSLSNEIMGRTSPGLVDLAVALVGGMAAAYAISRQLSSALPGVAIAAALVPPIAAAGITFSRGEWAFAKGALLLFLSNIVAIVLGTAISLWLVGIRDKHEHGSAQKWTLRFAVCLLLCSIGLAFLISHKVPVTGQAALETLREKVAVEVSDRGGELVSVDLHGENQIKVIIESPSGMSDDLPSRLRELANDHFGNQDSWIKLEIRHVVKSGPPKH